MSDAKTLAKQIFENIRDYTTAVLAKELRSRDEKITSLARRADRHADHLAALETRLKKLEVSK